MEFLIYIIAIILNFIATLLSTLQNWLLPRDKPKYPPIANELLIKPVGELILEMRQKKITSVQITAAYIARIKEVNAVLNAVVETRYEEALKEAQHADQLIAKTNGEQLLALYARYPMLGIPFTVKESCGVKDLSYCVGNVHRLKEKSTKNGEVVELLRAAGCIPLLVSSNPEFCLSFRTQTHTHGKCLNPYDLRRTSGGSSGGEGALNGAGASLFGLGSDIAGSIRLPSLYCGVFGHKPTGGLISVKGHFPNTKTDTNFPFYLQLGPITRFASDLPLLVSAMAGPNATQLKLNEMIPTKDIKIYYSYGFEGVLNRLMHSPTSFDIKLAITRAVKSFEKGGLKTKKVKINNFKNILALYAVKLLRIEGLESVMCPNTRIQPRIFVLISELVRSVVGHSLYTRDAIIMEIYRWLFEKAPNSCFDSYTKKLDALKTELMQLLGTDGVLLCPTFHSPALHHNLALWNIFNYDMLAIFNILGFPATQIPMGFDRRGCPIGFMVVAAPYQDKLCFQIAAEMEGAFGGWQPLHENVLISK